MKKKNNQGFTLIETIIYIGLLAVIIVFLISFFAQATFIKGKINERLDNLDNAQYALERMTWYLQNSIEVTEPLAGQSSKQLMANSLVSEKNPIKFFVEAKQLKMQIADGQAINLTNNRLDVDDISFTNQGFINQPALIQIKMTVLGKQSLWQTQPLTLQTSVKLEK
ncbi:MAG: prepilin-type N-terminal cleavage/methylation domain-containing protein [Candidatus Parcubacteria bacterium]|nr:prepilin-type N-terminal cleavage/methylation domain-containing protein [Candidatus Parcubacteria bacterium]